MPLSVCELSGQDFASRETCLSDKCQREPHTASEPIKWRHSAPDLDCRNLQVDSGRVAIVFSPASPIIAQLWHQSQMQHTQTRITITPWYLTLHSIICVAMVNEDIQLQIFEWYLEGGGKHWKTIAELTPKLSDFGITAMWIPRTFWKSGSPSHILNKPTIFFQLQRKLGPKTLSDMTCMTSMTLANSTRKADAVRSGARKKTLSPPLTPHGIMGSSPTWMLF